MALASGTRIAHFEILAKLGEGGMGEVYKAKDTRLERIVAIKVMSPAIASTPDVRQRFEREARSLSALNHPHICTLYDVGEQDGLQFLVLEYVEGETLAARLARGSFSADDVIRRGVELASALDRAHRAGVVHRDLKPANVILTKSGAKVLDFGLARLKPSVAPGDGSIVTTMNTELTGAGSILGTLHYMSPEQLQGADIDTRSDIFALGLVLYEMATGKRAFDASSQAGLIAAILEREPPAMGQASAFERLVKRCLAKDADDRWQSARDVMLELQSLSTSGQDAAVAAPSAPARPSARLLQIAAAGAAIVAIGAIALGLSGVIGPRPSEPPELRLQVITPSTPSPISIALSPDGTKLAFVATREQGAQTVLWVRDLNAVEARHLSGTEGAAFPFWSADNRSLGFFADSKLQRYDLATGTIQPLASAALGRGGAWNQDGTIIFAPAVGELFQIPASGGGTPVKLTTITSPHETSHRFPQFLPDGHRFIYFVQGSTEAQGVYVASLDNPKGEKLVTTDAQGVFAAPGSLLYVRQGSVFAQRMNPATATLSRDEPVKLADHVMFDGAFNTMAVSTSATGLIAYREGSENELVWVDRSGERLGVVPLPDQAPQNCPEISPNGQQVAIDRTLNGNRDIWLIDVARVEPTSKRLTLNSGIDATPIWSPDGTQIVFRSNRTGTNQLWVKPVVGAGEEARVPVSELAVGVSDWTKVGNTLLFNLLDPKTALDLWVYSLEDRQAKPVINSAAEERDGQFSPDARWIAYASNESSRMEVWVQAYPSGEKLQVSTGGGSQPRWRKDGRELFFITPNGSLMNASFTSANGRAQIGTPAPLFTPRISSSQGGLIRHQYAVNADGSKFLLNAVTERAANAPITVVSNWRGMAGR